MLVVQKFFMMHDFKEALPGCTVAGSDTSGDCLENAMPSVTRCCQKGVPHRPRKLAMLRLEELKKQQAEIEERIIDAKKSERSDTLIEIKAFCKELGFTASMLKVALAQGRKIND